MPVMVKKEQQEVAKSERTLAFNVKKVDGGLYAAQIIKYEGNKILEIRTGAGTTFGHATAEAEDLLTHFFLYEFENGSDSYIKTVRMI